MRKIIVTLLLLTGILHVKAQKEDIVLTSVQKIYGLSRFWQEANYNFAYFSNVPTLNWDSAYQAFIPQVTESSTTYDYYRQLQKFCALLKDGHTNVYFPEYISSKRVRRSFGDIKLELRNINGKPIVINTAVLTKDIVPIGSEITSVNNIPVQQYIDQNIRPYISQSADYILEDQCIDFLLDGFIGDTVRIGFKKPGSTFHSILLKRAVKDNVPWLINSANTLFAFKWMPGNISKIDLNSFDNEKIVDTFLTALPSLQKAKAIIIDLRKNGGGNSDYAAEILSYFTNADTIRGSKWFTRQHRAAFKAWGTYAIQYMADTSEGAREARDYYYGRRWYEGGQMETANKAPASQRMPEVPLAVLFGHQTASAAEDFLIMLDVLEKRATTIGQRSFGSTGQPLPFDLPGGGSARICTKKDTYPDGKIFVGKGIIPAIEINPTVEDYLKNRDAILEKAMVVLKQKM